MKRFLAPILLVVLLFPTLALGEEVTMNDLVERDGLHYKKFTDVPFDGKVTGKEQGSFKDGKKDGPWVRYHDNGELWSKGTYKNGEWDGPWNYYHDNGGLKRKGTYKDGEEEGLWVSYRDNGQLWTKGTFKNGKLDGVTKHFQQDEGRIHPHTI